MPFRKFLTSLVLSLLSSAFLALSFPKTNFLWLAWIALVPLLFVIERSTRRAAFGYSCLCGLAFFLVTLEWIHYVTALGLFLLCSYLALYFGLFGLLVRLFRGRSFGPRLFLVPAAWCVLEFARDRFLTGFGWGALGHSQAANILLIQIADVTGVAGVSFLVAAFNVLVLDVIRLARREKKEERKVVPGNGFLSSHFSRFTPALVFLFILTGALAYGAWRLASPAAGPKMRVALVQGNVALGEYWDPARKADVVGRYLELSREALSARPELIIWPETAFPQFVWELPDLFGEVLAFQGEARVPLILGLVTRREDRYFNSALFISGRGDEAGIYSKKHLVLFGEYIPFRRELPFLASVVPIDDFTPGTGTALFAVTDRVKAGTLICFEDTIPDLARELVQGGAGVLVNMTNDAWFRDSAQPEMHLNNALFRAVENRRPLVRATNTGVSCLVDPHGTVGACVQDGQGRRVGVRGWVAGDVGTGGGLTFYTKYGDVFTLFLFIGILGMLVQPFQGGILPWLSRITGKRS